MWKIEGNRVYGYGQSYTLNSVKTAEMLYDTLNNYENRLNKVKEAMVSD